MIRFHLPAADRLQLRIAYSALWECVASVRVLRDPVRHPVLAPWARRASRAGGADVRLLATLVRDGSAYVPDFLAPPPAGPDVDFDAELARLRATPPDLVAAEMARAARGAAGAPVGRLLARYGADAAALRDDLAGALERYWAAAIAPDWPRLQAVLEGEVLARARALAVDGAGATLGTLHRAVAHRPGVVDVDTPQDADVRVAGGELLLVPSVFAWPDVFTVHDPAWRASLYYPARGVGTLWEAWAAHAVAGGEPPRSGARASDPLALLAGAGRAAVLRALAEPATTGELAARLGAAPASVSAHLQRLRRAGLLHPTRVGRRVFYRTSARGRALLAAMDGAP